MTKHLFRTLTVNMMLALVSSSFVSFFMYRAVTSRDANSLEGRQATFLQAVAGVVWIVILTISALTVYLNLIKKVRQHQVVSFLTFFFAPVLLTAL